MRGCAMGAGSPRSRTLPGGWRRPRDELPDRRGELAFFGAVLVVTEAVTRRTAGPAGARIDPVAAGHDSARSWR
jgi:hypothetical protein